MQRKLQCLITNQLCLHLDPPPTYIPPTGLSGSTDTTLSSVPEDPLSTAIQVLTNQRRAYQHSPSHGRGQETENNVLIRTS